MSYVNVGARVNGKRPRTKAELRKAVAESPETVTFDVTSDKGPRAGERIPVSAIGTSKLSVTGPDPYTARTWYATVSVSTRTGRATVS